MDNTEIHYLSYDPDEILKEMKDAYSEAGGSPLFAGDEKEMLIQSVMSVIVQAFAGVDNAMRMATLRYAVGEYLDVIGENKGCLRLQAEKATATVTITTTATGVALTIPAGSLLTQDGVTLYVTDADITLTGNAGTLTANITAEKAGSRGNSLISGAQMQFLVNFEGVSQITCSASAMGGQDEEDDEAYRWRIRKWGLSTVTTGTSEQYERIAKETSSDIIDAKAIHGDDLDVEVYLLLKEDATAATVIAAVEAALSPKDARPLSDNVIVAEATDVLYTLNVQYSGADTTNLADAVAEAVKKYQEWQDNVIGQVFNPDILKSYLYQAGCTQVIFASGSEFDGGTVEYTEINENERCKGTITTAVISA